MPSRLTLKQVGSSAKGHGETCRQLRQDRGPTCKQFRHCRQRGTKPGKFFSGTGFGCLEKNLQPTDGVCEQYTHKYSTYRVAQHDYISSREHAWLKSWKAQDCTSWCPYYKFHSRVMSHSLPYLTLTTSTSSLSLISSTSPIFPIVSPTHTQDLWPSAHIYPAMFRGRVADQHKSHLWQVMSPNRLRSKPSRPKRSSLKTSIPEELSLTGILGQIRVKYRNDSWEITTKILPLKMWWIWRSWCRDVLSQMHSDYDSVESIADSDLEARGL